MLSMTDLNIVHIKNTPMKLVFNKEELYGCFWFGDNFYRREAFTPEMEDIYQRHHAATLKERLEDI